jgi:hypothetical protein
MMLLGAATGLIGALWTGLCTRLLAFRARWIPDSRPTLRNLETMFIAALTATVRFRVARAGCLRPLRGLPTRTLPPRQAPPPTHDPTPNPHTHAGVDYGVLLLAVCPAAAKLRRADQGAQQALQDELFRRGHQHVAADVVQIGGRVLIVGPAVRDAHRVVGWAAAPGGAAGPGLCPRPCAAAPAARPAAAAPTHAPRTASPPPAVRALMSVQHTPASDDDAASFLFSLTALAMFVVCAFAGLLLAYGVAAPTGERTGAGLCLTLGWPWPVVCQACWLAQRATFQRLPSRPACTSRHLHPDDGNRRRRRPHCGPRHAGRRRRGGPEPTGGVGGWRCSPWRGARLRHARAGRRGKHRRGGAHSLALNQPQVSLPTWSAVGAAGLLAGNTRLLLSVRRARRVGRAQPLACDSHALCLIPPTGAAAAPPPRPRRALQTILIVSETSGSGPALVPMILAAVASKLVADSINECAPRRAARPPPPRLLALSCAARLRGPPSPSTRGLRQPRPCPHRPPPRCVYDWQVEHAKLPFLEDKALLPPREISSLLKTQVGLVPASAGGGAPGGGRPGGGPTARVRPAALAQRLKRLLWCVLRARFGHLMPPPACQCPPPHPHRSLMRCRPTRRRCCRRGRRCARCSSGSAATRTR